MKGRGKREIPEKTRRPTASFGTIPTCEIPVTRPGIKPSSPWWEASVLTALPPRSLYDYCVWGWMKDIVYQRTAQTREELLASITHAATEIKDSGVQLRRATRAVHKRAANCMEVDGHIFEDLLYGVSRTGYLTYPIGMQLTFAFNFTRWGHRCTGRVDERTTIRQFISLRVEVMRQFMHVPKSLLAFPSF
ncbi:hypothetical protein PR048_010410 [Dryococelus australis]|uniref:Uncharacterized protein n=1 Tax=Dryococelus australis TaxID=614101 RepID=A0ABQ9I3H5_9NEOP|nr:hypothetical protein PR048_010410 [Dryococelus australis]